jgi:hypothetical protein
MDPLSITASVVALVTFTSQITSSLLSLKNSFTTAQLELNALEEELRRLSFILVRLQSLLEASGSSVVHAQLSQINDQDLQLTLRGCWKTISQIQKKIWTLQPLISEKMLHKLRNSLAWLVEKGSWRDLQTQLERDRKAVLLVLALCNL